MNDVLSTYLESGLLDIGDDDNRLKMLQQASQELSECFIAEPREALYHALTLYSASPIGDDASFLEAGAVLNKHWNTYRNRFKENPREILKPVSFRALQLATDQNDRLGLALGFLLRTVHQPANPTREQEVLSEFAILLDDEAEKAALDIWSIPNKSRKPIGNISAATVTKIDRETIAAAVTKAAGPTNAQNQAVAEANPHWPSANAPWTSEFGKQLSEVIAGNIEQALLRTSQEIPKGVNAAIKEANAHLTDVSYQAALAKRTQLLWWEKSAFSSRYREPYADLPKGINLLAMVADFYEISEDIAPYSAEYLLRKTVASVCGVQPIKTTDLVAAGRSATKELFGSLSIQFNNRVGAKTLIELILAKGIDVPKAKGGRAEKGSDAATPELHAVRLFNELQALSLARAARPVAK